jgi:hypothetical protein
MSSAGSATTIQLEGRVVQEYAERPEQDRLAGELQVLLAGPAAHARPAPPAGITTAARGAWSQRLHQLGHRPDPDQLQVGRGPGGPGR